VTDVLIEADDVAVTVIGSALLFGDATSLRVVPVRSPQ